MRIDKNTKIYLGQTEIVKIKKGNVVIWQSEPAVEVDYLYLENTYNGSNTITFTTSTNGSPSSGGYTDRIEYSKDKVNWTTLIFNTSTPQTVTINTGEKLYLRNNSGVFNYYVNGNKYITQINPSQSCVLGGNVNTLLDYNNADNLSLSGKYGCFYELFRQISGHSYITDASGLKLPANTLEENCYNTMFGYCSALTSAPALPATTLAESCYSSMFQNCSSLVNAPELPATTLARSCYGSMFYDCRSLTTAPQLPATTLADYCYSAMFASCTSLTTAPALPATTLASYCYSSMFNYCSSLTTAPALPATTLADYCYNSMFDSCGKLNKILVCANSGPTSGTNNWLYNVAASGTFYNAGSITYTQDSGSGIPTGWTEVTTVPTSVYAVPDTFSAKSWQDKNRCNFTLIGRNVSGIDIPIGKMSELITIGKNTGSSTVTHTETLTYDGMDYTITINQSANDTDEPDYFYVETISSDNVVNVNNYKYNNYTVSDLTPTIEYSTDKVNWNVITFDWTNTGLQQAISLNNVGDKVYFRNDTGLFSNVEDASNRYKYIYFTFGQNKQVNVGGDLCSLLDYRDVENVNMTKDGMFRNLFSPNNYSSLSTEMMIVDASSLVLPATTAPHCYRSMFSGCTSLTTAPQLPATTLADYCYSAMFNKCTSLTSAPVLPATTLASNCYNTMFYGCTSLTTAPTLPATTLTQSCYPYMFQNCTSLTTAPALPATTLTSNCYYNMFSGCTSLTTAPQLPATTLATYCYGSMFKGCSALTTAPALPATTLASNCYNAMFQDCSSLTSAPELPATTIVQQCYFSMFQNCTSLTIAPELPATTLVISCYTSLFKGCTSLNSVTCYAQDISATNCLYNWLQNVAASGTFNNNGLTEYPSGNSGIPTGWTEVLPIQSITANPDTFTLKSYQTKVRCESTLTITTTVGTTVTKTNIVRLTVGENTGDSTRTLTETIPYKGSSYQVTIVQTANDPVPPYEWEVISDGTYPFELNLNDYYESTNKGKNNSYSYATLNYSGFDNLVLECISYTAGEANYDYGIISQPDVQLSESYSDDGATGSANVFHNFKGESSTTPVQITIPSDGGSHFITIKFRKDSTQGQGNDSFQFKVIEPTT